MPAVSLASIIQNFNDKTPEYNQVNNQSQNDYFNKLQTILLILQFYNIDTNTQIFIKTLINSEISSAISATFTSEQTNIAGVASSLDVLRKKIDDICEDAGIMKSVFESIDLAEFQIIKRIKTLKELATIHLLDDYTKKLHTSYDEIIKGIRDFIETYKNQIFGVMIDHLKEIKARESNESRGRVRRPSFLASSAASNLEEYHKQLEKEAETKAAAEVNKKVQAEAAKKRSKKIIDFNAMKEILKEKIKAKLIKSDVYLKETVLKVKTVIKGMSFTAYKEMLESFRPNFKQGQTAGLKNIKNKKTINTKKNLLRKTKKSNFKTKKNNNKNKNNKKLKRKTLKKKQK
jgi:hypothetical protein